MGAQVQKSGFGWLWFAALAGGLWGFYGVFTALASPQLHHQSELIFLYVCRVYAVIGLPYAMWMILSGRDHGEATAKGIAFGIGGGILAAIGALAVINAVRITKNPVAVMAMVFALAQGFNFLYSLIFQRPTERIRAIFLFGIVMLGFGSWIVQQYKPGALSGKTVELSTDWLLYTVAAAACWGTYGANVRMSTKHSKGSHYIPLACVSASYALFGEGMSDYFVIFPTEHWNLIGCLLAICVGFSGLGGAIFAIRGNSCADSPGPVTVMPLLFAIAAVVNSVVTIGLMIAKQGAMSLHPMLLVGLLVLLAGGYIVPKYSPIKPPAKK